MAEQNCSLSLSVHRSLYALHFIEMHEEALSRKWKKRNRLFNCEVYDRDTHEAFKQSARFPKHRNRRHYLIFASIALAAGTRTQTRVAWVAGTSTKLLEHIIELDACDLKWVICLVRTANCVHCVKCALAVGCRQWQEWFRIMRANRGDYIFKPNLIGAVKASTAAATERAYAHKITTN